ncbi:hypothetical protein ACFOQM_06315 [Paenibacillus sp. GCM10012307]|uniref:Uncharacterized protein n=1 Tax=Paenibacillus roseus TaxID=2798579 RepID=A0A934J5X7_9BACL|nr:hypothetical protein [Paenibacillus roseus]MBJ6360913.1 hypothetical protein [Paenibacillus roseus]
MSQEPLIFSDASEQVSEKRNLHLPTAGVPSSVTKEDESSKDKDFGEKLTLTTAKRLHDTEGLSIETAFPTARKAIPSSKRQPVLRPKGNPPSVPMPLAGARSDETPSSSESPTPLPKKAPPFSERYRRMTTYLENPLFHRVHALHRQGEFPKIANLLNSAVREYLDRHYPSP